MKEVGLLSPKYLGFLAWFTDGAGRRCLFVLLVRQADASANYTLELREGWRFES